MVNIQPFKGTRPYNESAENLIAPSTDHLSEDGAIDMFENKYWNYLKILNPVGTTKEEDALKAAKKHFLDMKNNKIIKKDSNASYYIYQIKTNNHIQLGFLGIANTNHFITKKLIRGHELTYEKRMLERSEQMLNLESQIGPIYVTYKDNKNLDDLLFQLSLSTPQYEFYAFDNSHHTLWCIEDRQDIENITNLSRNLNYLYVADGHHRIAALHHLNNIKSSQNTLHTGSEGYNFFMFSAFPASKSKIYDYNRVIKNLNGLNVDKFLSLIKSDFIAEISNKPVKPSKIREFGMFHNDQWYLIKFKNEKLLKDDILSKLDINIINNYCFKNILGIKNFNQDERIRFIAGCHGLEALEKKVRDNPDSVAFSIFPTSIEDVITVAENNLTMPPKSTWFDPKPLDGLVVYEFDQI